MSNGVTEFVEEKLFSQGYSWLDRIFIPVARKVVPRWVTPNRITYVRTLLAGPVLWAAAAGWWESGSWWRTLLLFLAMYLPACLLDYVDGLVARARGMVSDLGAFLDAFCDKIFFITLIIGRAHQLSVHAISWQLAAGLALAMSPLVLIEILLGAVRLEDWLYNQMSTGEKRNLKATSSGKWKFCLELTAAGGLLFGDPEKRLWPFAVAVIAGLAAVPFAWKSFRQKLQAR